MSFLAKLVDRIRNMFFNQEMELTLVGLHNSGKTTLLNRISGQDVGNTIPTVGFNMRKVKKGKVSFKMWDLGGQPRFRSLWERYCETCTAIVYVMDASDRSAVNDAKKELHELLTKDPLAGIPLLVLANKNDVDGHMTDAEVQTEMGLADIQKRTVAMYSISARNNINIEVVLKWLTQQAKLAKKNKK